MRLFLSMLMLLALTGCQVTHSLPEPQLAREPLLPEIHLQIAGPVPGHWIRNELRQAGVFEQVAEGARSKRIQPESGVSRRLLHCAPCP